QNLCETGSYYAFLCEFTPAAKALGFIPTSPLLPPPAPHLALSDRAPPLPGPPRNQGIRKDRLYQRPHRLVLPRRIQDRFLLAFPLPPDSCKVVAAHYQPVKS